MTVPAAHAGQHGPKTIEYYREHPGNERLAGCPNCHDPEHLELIERVTTHRPVAAVWLIETATTPEVDSGGDEWADRVIQTAKPVDLMGVRCLTCRWSYEGPNPLPVLTAVPE
jgi:hypothetical protein